MPHKAGIGVIRGIVSEDGIPSQKRVTLMDRTNLRRLSTIVSGADGDYTFGGLDPETDDYMIFSLDDDKEAGGNYKDPIIFDRVRPVSAVIGARQMGEWFYLAQKQGLRASYVPILASPNSNPNSINSGSGFGASNWFPVGANQIDGRNMTVVPVIPNLSNVKLESSVAACYATSEPNYLSNYNTWSVVSLEWVIDLNDVSGNPGLFHLPWNRYYYSPAIATSGSHKVSASSSFYGVNGYIGYIPGRRAIQIGYNNNSNDAEYILGSPFSQALNNISSYSSQILEYILPAELASTTLHIVAVIVQGSSTVMSKIYVNGVKVAEKYLTASRPVSTSERMVHHLMLGGSLASGKTLNTEVAFGDFTNAIQKTSLAALYYNKNFTDAEVLEHYNALFNPDRTPTIPTDTGYMYEVKLRRPFIFFPLNESIAENGSLSVVEDGVAKWSLGRVTISNTITNTETSIVLGRTLLDFNNGALANTAVSTAFAPASDGVSIAFVASPKIATPAKSETLFQHSNRAANDYNCYFAVSWGVYRNTLGKFQVSYGSTVTFNTLPEVGVQHHYCFTLDIPSGTAQMYVDGILVETINQSLGRIAQYSTQAEYYVGTYDQAKFSGVVTIGASYSPGTKPVAAYLNPETHYTGVFGMFSAHPYVMTELEVENLYDFLDVM